MDSGIFLEYLDEQCYRHDGQESRIQVAPTRPVQDGQPRKCPLVPIDCGQRPQYEEYQSTNIYVTHVKVNQTMSKNGEGQDEKHEMPRLLHPFPPIVTEIEDKDAADQDKQNDQSGPADFDQRLEEIAVRLLADIRVVLILFVECVPTTSARAEKGIIGRKFQGVPVECHAFENAVLAEIDVCDAIRDALGQNFARNPRTEQKNGCQEPQYRADGREKECRIAVLRPSGQTVLQPWLRRANGPHAQGGDEGSGKQHPPCFQYRRIRCRKQVWFFIVRLWHHALGNVNVIRRKRAQDDECRGDRNQERARVGDLPVRPKKDENDQDKNRNQNERASGIGQHEREPDRDKHEGMQTCRNRPLGVDDGECRAQEVGEQKSGVCIRILEDRSETIGAAGKPNRIFEGNLPRGREQSDRDYDISGQEHDDLCGDPRRFGRDK